MTTAQRSSFVALWVATIATALLGVGFVVIPRPTIEVLQYLSLAGPAEPGAYVDFVYGVLGAVMIGWMTMFAGLLHGPIRDKQRWAIGVALASIVIWFVIDSAMSWHFDQTHNVLLNIVSVVSFVVPLVVLGFGSTTARDGRSQL